MSRHVPELDGQRVTSIAKAILEADENAFDQHSKDCPFGA